MSEISQIVNFLKNNYLSNISYKKKNYRQIIKKDKKLEFLLKNDYLVERQTIDKKFLIKIRKNF